MLSKSGDVRSASFTRLWRLYCCRLSITVWDHVWLILKCWIICVWQCHLVYVRWSQYDCRINWHSTFPTFTRYIPWYLPTSLQLLESGDHYFNDRTMTSTTWEIGFNRDTKSSDFRGQGRPKILRIITIFRSYYNILDHQIVPYPYEMRFPEPWAISEAYFPQIAPIMNLPL